MWGVSTGKKALCIIDDDAKEVERARKYLGKLNFCIGGGRSVGAALTDLRAQGGPKRPHIYLIDMYGPEEQTDSEAEQKLAESRARYLRAEARFYSTLDAMKQNTTRGFRNVRLARKKHKLFRIPVAFFTRKGTLNNVLDAYEESPECPVLKKPDPTAARILSGSEELTGDQLGQLYDEAVVADDEASV